MNSQALVGIGVLGVIGTLGALRTLLQTQQIQDLEDHVLELENTIRSSGSGSGFGNSASMATMAAYIADNGQCCATNSATISNVKKDITSAEESVSSICSSVIFLLFKCSFKSKSKSFHR